MTFFQGFPAPDFPTRPRTPKPVRPEWSGARADELPAVVHLGQFLYRSPTRILAVRGAHVYSTGCLVDVSWLLRRGDETDQEWAMLHATFFSSRHVPASASRRTELLFGVQFPDGSKASTGSIPSPYKPDDPTYRPDPPVLYLQNRGGGGGDDELSGSGVLWLALSAGRGPALSRPVDRHGHGRIVHHPRRNPVPGRRCRCPEVLAGRGRAA